MLGSISPLRSSEMSSLLPPNATALEKNVEQLGQRTTQLPVPFVELNRIDQCPMPFLAWLAWDHRVEYWRSDWSQAEKRQAISESKTFNAQRGTRSSMESLISKFATNFQLKAWHEFNPPQAPFTFVVIINELTVSIDQLLQIQTAVEATKSARDDFSISAKVVSSGQFQMTGASHSGETVYLSTL